MFYQCFVTAYCNHRLMQLAHSTTSFLLGLPAAESAASWLFCEESSEISGSSKSSGKSLRWEASSAPASASAGSSRTKTVRVKTEVPQLRSWPKESASISTEVPALSPLSQSRTRSLPKRVTRSPLETEPAALIANWRNAVMVNQLVSPSTHLLAERSKRRCDDASRNGAEMIRATASAMASMAAASCSPRR